MSKKTLAVVSLVLIMGGLAALSLSCSNGEEGETVKEEIIVKRLLGPNVNTDRTEILPIPSADGKTLYFTRMNYADREIVGSIEDKRTGFGESCEKIKAKKETLAPELYEYMMQMCRETEEGLKEIEDEVKASKFMARVYVSYQTKDGEWTKAQKMPRPFFLGAGFTGGVIYTVLPDNNTILAGGYDEKNMPATVFSDLFGHDDQCTEKIKQPTREARRKRILDESEDMDEKLKDKLGMDAEAVKKKYGIDYKKLQEQQADFFSVMEGAFAKKYVNKCAGIWLSKKTSKGWGEPRQVLFEEFEGLMMNDLFYTTTSPEQLFAYYMSPDGKHLIFSTSPVKKRKEKKAEEIKKGKELYISHLKSDGEWTKPKDLGPSLNTEFDEDSPFIAPDNTTLYFASNRPGGEGGYDIYMTRRQDDGWLTWSEPVNLGPEVNTAWDDRYFSVNASGEYAFMSTGEKGQEDIYEFGLTGDLKPLPVVVVQGKVLRGGELLSASYPGMGTDGDGVLPKGGGGGGNGSGSDGDGGSGGSGGKNKGGGFGTGGGGVGGGGLGFADCIQKGEPPVVVYERLSDGKVLGQADIDPTDGSYQLILPRGEHYGIYAKVPCSAGMSHNVDLSNLLKTQILVNMDLTAIPLEVGATIRLNNIFFDVDKSELLPKSKAELDRLTHILNQYPEMEIEIAGHTDSQASYAYNQKLSEDRAQAVYGYLTNNNIEDSRMAAHGYGEEHPVASNETKEGRQLNRRVEFRILKMISEGDET